MLGIHVRVCAAGFYIGVGRAIRCCGDLTCWIILRKRGQIKGLGNGIRVSRRAQEILYNHTPQFLHSRLRFAQQ